MFLSRIVYERESVKAMKGKEAALRIGQAATQLGISPHHLRRLCECGQVEAEQSPGGQWRVPLPEIQRLQNEGAPPIPTFIEEESETEEEADSAAELDSHAPAAVHSLAPQSPAVIEAFEEAEIEEAAVRREAATVRRKESTVRRLHLELEEQEAQDQLNARQVRESALAKLRAAEARQLEEVQQHRVWVEQWADNALLWLSSDVPGSVRIGLHDAIVRRLADVPRTQSRSLTQKLIDAETSRVLAPWKLQQAIDQAVESVCARLPYEIRYYQQHIGRKSQAAQAARKTIEQLGDVPKWQMEAAGTVAVKPFVAEFEHEQRCTKLSSTLPSGLTRDEQDEAREKILEALAPFPINTSQRGLEQAQKEALAPFRQVLAKREHLQLIENVLRWVSYELPSGMSSSDQKEAVEEIRAAVAKLPVGTSQREVEAAKDRAVDKIQKEHDEHQRIKAIIERGLREIQPYVQRLVERRRLELELMETTFSVARILEEPVRQELEAELDGSETDEDVRKLVHEIVRDEFEMD